MTNIISKSELKRQAEELAKYTQNKAEQQFFAVKDQIIQSINDEMVQAASRKCTTFTTQISFGLDQRHGKLFDQHIVEPMKAAGYSVRRDRHYQLYISQFND